MAFTCATCDYCRPRQDERMECRIKPPVLLLGANGVLYSGWPEVDKDDWCADHAPKLIDPAKEQVD